MKKIHSIVLEKDVIRQADVTCYHDSSSLLSVCVDSWFILGAMIVHAPQPHPAPESNQSDSGQVRL